MDLAAQLANILAEYCEEVNEKIGAEIGRASCRERV